jgi:hypothetical protein
MSWIATNGEEGLSRLSKSANSHEDALTEFVLADIRTPYLQDTNYVLQQLIKLTR